MTTEKLSPAFREMWFGGVYNVSLLVFNVWRIQVCVYKEPFSLCPHFEALIFLSACKDLKKISSLCTWDCFCSELSSAFSSSMFLHCLLCCVWTHSLGCVSTLCVLMLNSGGWNCAYPPVLALLFVVWRNQQREVLLLNI